MTVLRQHEALHRGIIREMDAAHPGVCQQRVSQLQQQAIKKLKHYVDRMRAGESYSRLSEQSRRIEIGSLAKQKIILTDEDEAFFEFHAVAHHGEVRFKVELKY